MIYLILPTKKGKGKTIVSTHITSNETHLSNVVFAKPTRASCENLIKLSNSFSKLVSLIIWVTISHVHGPKCRTG